MYHMTDFFHTAVPQNLVLTVTHNAEERNTRMQPGGRQSRSLVGDLTVRYPQIFARTQEDETGTLFFYIVFTVDTLA